MALSDIILYSFCILTALSVLFIMWTKNILYAAFALIFTFVGVAGIFIFMGAEFIAITQVLIYVGGILVLLVFGIMLTNRLSGKKVLSTSYNKALGFMVSAGFFIILLKGILQANFSVLTWVNKDETSTVSIKKFGLTLMTDYVLAFEIIGILLLLALIGAVRIAANARKEESNAV